jgi:hypothetical protein
MKKARGKVRAELLSWDQARQDGLSHWRPPLFGKDRRNIANELSEVAEATRSN